MTADEIRRVSSLVVDNANNARCADAQANDHLAALAAQMLAEIAAQLAELNTTLSKIGGTVGNYATHPAIRVAPL